MVNEILFIIDRNLYYRHYGPFINSLLESGNSIHLLHDYGQVRGGSKGGYFPALYSSPNFDYEISFIGAFKNKSDIVNYINKKNISHIFSLHSFFHYNIEMSEIDKSKWINLQHWADNFQIGSKEVFGCDYFLSYSKKWWESFLLSKYNDKQYNNFDTKAIHVGHPLNFLYDDLESKSIKEKYNLPMDKKVLTYLPIGPPSLYDYNSFKQKLWLKLKYSPTPHKIFHTILNKFIKHIYFNRNNNIDEQKIILAIKEFCKNNNMTFVIKTRLKSQHSQFLLDNVDYIFFEETFYPPTITELLYVSDIAISHFSMATFESIAMKSYKININLEPVFDIFTDHFTKLFESDWIDDFNREGLGSIISGADFINEFGLKKITEFQFDEKYYDDFMSKYFSGINRDEFTKKMNKVLKNEL